MLPSKGRWCLSLHFFRVKLDSGKSTQTSDFTCITCDSRLTGCIVVLWIHLSLYNTWGLCNRSSTAFGCSRQRQASELKDSFPLWILGNPEYHSLHLWILSVLNTPTYLHIKLWATIWLIVPWPSVSSLRLCHQYFMSLGDSRCKSNMPPLKYIKREEIKLKFKEWREMKRQERK